MNIGLLNRCLPLIYPSFYIRKDECENELVFLKIGEVSQGIMRRQFDKTESEALENHFHLFERIKKKELEKAATFGVAVATNLMHSLMVAFPEKKFIVYLELNRKDTTIIRFHQQWEDEVAYYQAEGVMKDGTIIKIFDSNC